MRKEQKTKQYVIYSDYSDGFISGIYDNLDDLKLDIENDTIEFQFEEDEINLTLYELVDTGLKIKTKRVIED